MRQGEPIYLVECQACFTQWRIDLTEMAKRMDDPLEWVKARLKCKCGSSRLFITTFRHRPKT